MVQFLTFNFLGLKCHMVIIKLNKSQKIINAYLHVISIATTYIPEVIHILYTK